MAVYEMRIYTTIPGRMPNLLKRFDEHTLGIWKKHGIEQVGFWTTLVGPNCGNELTYILKWDSLADREKKWNAFFVDPEWTEARANSEKDGPINERVANMFLSPTKFSALQ